MYFKFFPVIFVHWFFVRFISSFDLEKEKVKQFRYREEREDIFIHKTDVKRCLLFGILILGWTFKIISTWPSLTYKRCQFLLIHVKTYISAHFPFPTFNSSPILWQNAFSFSYILQSWGSWTLETPKFWCLQCPLIFFSQSLVEHENKFSITMVMIRAMTLIYQTRGWCHPFWQSFQERKYTIAVWKCCLVGLPGKIISFTQMVYEFFPYLLLLFL